MTRYYRDSLSGELKATRYAPEQWERQTLEFEGIKFAADVIPIPHNVTMGGWAMGRFKDGKYQHTNFIGWEVDVLEIDHPKYGRIDKTMIGQPFSINRDGKVVEKSGKYKWVLKSFDCNGIVVEAELKRKNFKRKIYKFI